MSLSSDGTVMTMPVQPANSGGWGGFGGDGAWWIIILFLFVFCGWGGNWGNGGFGGNNGSGVVDGYVLTSDFANVERKIDSVNDGLCNGFYQQAQLVNGTNMAMANGFAQAELSRSNQQAALMQQLNAMQMQAANCCCENRAAIAQVRYDMATQACDTRNTIQTGTRDLIDNQNANARAILDAINAQAVAAKDAKIAEQSQTIFGLQLAASQSAQNAYLIGALRPTPIPAYQAQNPYCCYQQCACGG